MSDKKRQGLNVSIKQLRKLLKDCETTRIKDAENLGISPYPLTTKFLIPIINNQGYSDTWELEQ